MAPLAYCESCGAHLLADQPQFATTGGVRCEACAAAEPEGEQGQEAAEDAFTQFPCCYCRSLLRLKPVAKRTRIRCPRCDDHFYLHPDGRVEAKLEGSTTAVMATPHLTPPLTPAAGTRAGTPPGGALTPPAEPPPDKTQPLKRLAPGESDQHALLDGLKPKRMDFLEGVPDRPKEEAQVDLSAYATRTPSRTAPRPAPPALPTRPAPDAAEDSGPLELLPHDVGPGNAPAPRPRQAKLRDSEEGQVDLGAEELKRKTKKYVKGAGGEAEPSATRTTKRRAQQDDRRSAGSAPEPEPVPSSRRTTEKRKVEPEPPPSSRTGGSAEERDKRAAEAAARARELERQQARGALGSGVLLLLVIAPLGIALLLVSMTARGAGFATRGVFGEKLRDLGAAADRGVRSFGATVNPALPPDVLRLPEPERR